MNLEGLSFQDSKQIEGGFIFLLSALLANAMVVGTFGLVGTAIYANFEKGYTQACGCK